MNAQVNFEWELIIFNIRSGRNPSSDWKSGMSG